MKSTVEESPFEMRDSTRYAESTVDRILPTVAAGNRLALPPRSYYAREAGPRATSA